MLVYQNSIIFMWKTPTDTSQLVRTAVVVEEEFFPTATWGDNEPIPRSKTNFDKQHNGEVYAPSKATSNCVFQFCKRKHFEPEDKLVGFANARLVNRPTFVKVQRTAAPHIELLPFI